MVREVAKFRWDRALFGGPPATLIAVSLACALLLVLGLGVLFGLSTAGIGQCSARYWGR